MIRPRAPLKLPGVLQRRIEDAARNYLYPQGVHASMDFHLPAGEPALATPDSVSWQVFKNPVTLFIGGVAAVILELAEPRVRDGVWRNTSFRSDPALRLRRTGLAAMVTVYGPRSQAESMISGIRAMHGRIKGITPEGQPYSANDPELLEWVHATASFGFLQAYHRYVRPLDAAVRNRFYAEGKPSAELFGALNAPASETAIDALFERMHGKLNASSVVVDFLRIMQNAPILPFPFASVRTTVQRMLVLCAVELVPPAIRERLGLGDQWRATTSQLGLVRQAAMAADLLLIRSFPATQACLRMGLPEDYLYCR